MSQHQLQIRTLVTVAEDARYVVMLHERPLWMAFSDVIGHIKPASVSGRLRGDLFRFAAILEKRKCRVTRSHGMKPISPSGEA